VRWGGRGTVEYGVEGWSEWGGAGWYVVGFGGVGWGGAGVMGCGGRRVSWGCAGGIDRGEVGWCWVGWRWAGKVALREETQDKTRITGPVTDPLGCDRNRETTQIDGTLIDSQMPSLKANSSMVSRHYPHHNRTSVTTFCTISLFIWIIREGHGNAKGHQQLPPPPLAPSKKRIQSHARHPAPLGRHSISDIWCPWTKALSRPVLDRTASAGRIGIRFSQRLAVVRSDERRTKGLSSR